MRPERPLPVVNAVMLLAALFSAPAAAGPLRLVEDAALRLDIQPILVVEGQSGALAHRQLEVDPRSGGKLDFELHWPDPARASRLALRVAGTPGPADGEHRLELSAEFALPDGRLFRAQRALSVRDGATGLFEVYRAEGHSLTLAVRADRVVRRIEVQGRQVGDPVRFDLEVEGVRGERHVVLETNQLHTFMDETVEYSFRRGEQESAESVQLLLTPVRRGSDIIEIALEVAGSLPGDGERLLLSRRETLVTSRRATSSVTVTAGDPPSGYRFRITPDF